MSSLAWIFRFAAPLLFANAWTFRDQVRALAATDPRPKWIVIAAEPVTDVDTTAADMLEALDEELNAIRISLVFAGLKDRVWEKVERYELIGPLEPHFFPTLYVAIDEFRRQTGGRVEAARHPPHGADPEGPAHPRNRGLTAEPPVAGIRPPCPTPPQPTPGRRILGCPRLPAGPPWPLSESGPRA